MDALFCKTENIKKSNHFYMYPLAYLQNLRFIVHQILPSHNISSLYTCYIGRLKHTRV